MSTVGGTTRSRSLPDLPGYGQFVGLRLSSEQRVGDLLREAAEAAASGEAAVGSTAQQIGDMFASFLDEEAVESLGVEPIRADLAAVAERVHADRARRPARAAGARGLGRRRRSRRTSTPTTASPTGTSSTSPRPGSGCPTRPTTARTSSRRSARRTSPTSRECSSSSMSRTRPAQRSGSWASRRGSRLGTGTRSPVATSSRPTTCSHSTTWWPPRRRSTSPPGRPASVRPQGAFDEVIVRQPSYLATLSEALTDVPLDDWKAWLTWQVVHSSAPFLTRGDRLGELRLLPRRRWPAPRSSATAGSVASRWSSRHSARRSASCTSPGTSHPRRSSRWTCSSPTWSRPTGATSTPSSG